MRASLKGPVLAAILILALAAGPAASARAGSLLAAQAPTQPAMPGQPVLLAQGLVGDPGTPAAITADASDDRQNTTSTTWWVYSGQTLSDVSLFISNNNARIIDIDYDTAATRYAAVYVSNTGAYQKAWWWYSNVDAAALSNAISTNNGRLISLKAYDTGSGVRFTAVMIANTGADAKGWWWYYDQTVASITTNWQNNNARLVQVTSYQTGGNTRYAVVMIVNSGADNASWYWYVDATPAGISNLLNSNNAFLYDLDVIPTSGHYNVIMLGCGTACPHWWWYIGRSGTDLLGDVAQNGSRIVDLETYNGCGGTCYDYLMVNNANALTTRVGDLLRNGTDGIKGLYLKQVGGSVLAGLEENFVFEPASTLKIAAALYAMRQVQAGSASLATQITRYVPPVGSSCPGNTANGSESLETALAEMMRHSDNTRTREIVDHVGAANINAFLDSVGAGDLNINHVLGCGGPPANTMTLVEVGKLYEGIADGTLLDAAHRDLLYSLIPGKAQFKIEGYDWTHLYDTDLPAMIQQEAPAWMTPVEQQIYLNQMNIAYKAGNYKLCTSGGCATYVDHISIAGWAQVPFCQGHTAGNRQYVFGIFINNSTSDATSGATFDSAKAELLREQVRDGMASCQLYFNNIYLPMLSKAH